MFLLLILLIIIPFSVNHKSLKSNLLKGLKSSTTTLIEDQPQEELKILSDSSFLDQKNLFFNSPPPKKIDSLPPPIAASKSLNEKIIVETSTNKMDHSTIIDQKSSIHSNQLLTEIDSLSIPIAASKRLDNEVITEEIVIGPNNDSNKSELTHFAEIKAKQPPNLSNSLVKVFNLGENENLINQLQEKYDTTYCNPSESKNRHQRLYRQIENFADSVNYNLKGVKILMHLYWSENGKVEYIGYYPQLSSKNIDMSRLSTFLRRFVIQFNLSDSFDHCNYKFAELFYISFPQRSRKSNLNVLKADKSTY